MKAAEPPPGPRWIGRAALAWALLTVVGVCWLLVVHAGR
jgi:hypothetical protein